MKAISQEGSTAQVGPLRLSHFLLQSCIDGDVQLHHPAIATRIEKGIRDELSNIRILNTETNAEINIPCTKILIAAGAWSHQVFLVLFPSSRFKLPIKSLAGYSLVVQSPRWGIADEEKRRVYHR